MCVVCECVRVCGWVGVVRAHVHALDVVKITSHYYDHCAIFRTELCAINSTAYLQGMMLT